MKYRISSWEIVLGEDLTDFDSYQLSSFQHNILPTITFNFIGNRLNIYLNLFANRCLSDGFIKLDLKRFYFFFSYLDVGENFEEILKLLNDIIDFDIL